MWVGQFAVAASTFLTAYLEKVGKVGRCLAAAQVEKLPVALFTGGQEVFRVFLFSQGWEERRRLAATQQQLHMQCRWVQVQYLWIT